MTIGAYLSAPALITPGIEDWATAVASLKGEREYQSSDLEKYKPNLLPPNERRRATAMIRLAFHAGEQTLAQSSYNAEQLASVFASSGGDDDIVDQICMTLLQADRPVSPIQFHNSVHNSASGYWSIATKSHHLSQSVSAGRATFIEGLTEAMVLVALENQPVLFIVYEQPAPEAMFIGRQVEQPFAASFILSSEAPVNSLSKISLFTSEEVTGKAEKDRVESVCDNQGLERLRLSSPAARSLPLLQAIVNDQTADLCFKNAGKRNVVLHCEPANA